MDINGKGPARESGAFQNTGKLPEGLRLLLTRFRQSRLLLGENEEILLRLTLLHCLQRA